jgi:hypothetical protein
MKVRTLDKKLLLLLDKQTQAVVVEAEIFLEITTEQMQIQVLVVQVSLLLED